MWGCTVTGWTGLVLGGSLTGLTVHVQHCREVETAGIIRPYSLRGLTGQCTVTVWDMLRWGTYMTCALATWCTQA